MDPQVTCPRCHERQPLPSPDGYTCVSCGAPWVFVSCRSCRERFHMNPATQGWDCPRCGAQNGPAAPAPTAAQTSAPSRGIRPAAASGSRGPSLGGRGPKVAVVAGALILIVLVWAIFLRGSGGTASPSASTPTAATSGATLAHLCTDVAPDMPLRVDSVRRTEAAVRADAKALKEEGDAAAAKKAVALADALETLAVALDTQGDTLGANQQVQQALADLPC